VKKERGGRVEAVVEGEKANVEAVLSWCGHGPPRARVEQVKMEWEPFSGKYLNFSIRY